MDAYTICARVGLQHGEDPPDRLQRCLRCGEPCEDAVHWMLYCRGINGATAEIRDRHMDYIAAQIGVDLRTDGFPWWTVPLAAGHTHPDVIQYCRQAHGGRLLPL